MTTLVFVAFAIASVFASPRPEFMSQAWLEARASDAAQAAGKSPRSRRYVYEAKKNRKNFAELVTEAKMHLDAHGVSYSRQTSKDGAPILVITPAENGKALNELAWDLQFVSAKTRLLYSPAELDRLSSEGAVVANSFHRDVCIDESPILMNRVTESVMHELAHAFADSPSLRGPDNAFSSTLECAGGQRCLFNDDARGSYAAGMHVEELWAYYAQEYFQLLVYKRKRIGRMTPYAQHQTLRRIRNKISDTLMLADEMVRNFNKILDNSFRAKLELFSAPSEKSASDLMIDKTPVRVHVKLDSMWFAYTAPGSTATLSAAVDHIKRTRSMVNDTSADLRKLFAAIDVSSEKEITDERIEPMFEMAATLYKKMLGYQKRF